VRVLIVGMSTRAAAESAARAGFTVTAIDAFGDLDQHPSVRGLSLRRDFNAAVSAPAMANASRTIECDAVTYLSNFENHPGAVSTLAAGRALWGNGPTVLGQVRDPIVLAQTLRTRACAVPKVVVADAGTAEAVPDAESECGHWLVKPLASGGGHCVRQWRRGARLPRDCYGQELVDGTPGSVVFVAAGGRAVPFGVSRQLVGEHAFGASGYRYCGSILAAAGDAQFPRDEALVDAAGALARTVAEEFGIVGVNGIDFIARDGVPYAIEVNPRWSASMELVERAYGLSVFGGLPEFDLKRARRAGGAAGKAVVFARRDVVAGDTRAWLPDDDAGDVAVIRDIPHPGERIPAGRPVCTVFAAGPDAATCYDALVRRAEMVYADLL
jgi:predicted ATP-grasp superfamily ATP-dependent carboligase